MSANDLLIELRKFVLIKSGLRSIDPGHCKTISERVFQETKNYVSETTIKRFFGFANTLHKFSLFTLNSLSQYIGYADWESFSKDKENTISCAQNLWHDLRLKCHAITDISLISKKNTSGVPFNATANRSFFYPDFDYFLKNNYQFTTLSSHPGNGKSILLAHIIEHFFYSEHSIYKNDIVLAINATKIHSILRNGLTLKNWFLKEFKFNSLNEMISFFKKNPEKREGKFILIVDGIDEFLSKKEYTETFTNFLFSIEENNFTKIVLGLRSNTWANLLPTINNSAFLTKSWYKSLFYDAVSNTNVPALNTEEVLHTLSYIENKPLTKNDISDALLKQFKSPFWLQIYYKIKAENEFIDLKNPILCYELTHYYLEKKVFLSKNSTEKTFLLKKISEFISQDKKGLKVPKEKILNFINNYSEAYEELLLTGIIIEEKRLSTSIPTEVVRFISNDIYTYFIFIQTTEKFQYKASKEFFEYILTNFSKLPSLRNHILNWAIRFCINRNEVGELKHILKLPFTNEEKNHSMDFICHVAQYEFSKPSSNFNKQSISLDFVDIMVMGRTTSNLYKETIKTISENVLDEDVQILLHIIECNIALISVDKTSLTNAMHLLKRNYKRLGELFPINPYDLLLYSYNNLIGKSIEAGVLEDKIIKLCHKIDKSESKKNEELGTLEILTYRLVLVTLFSQKNYAESHRFIMAILNKYPNIFFIRYSVFSSFLLIHLGQTYLKLNYFKKAQRIVQFLDKIIESDYTYSTTFIKTSYLVFKANFYNYTGNYDKALQQVKTGLEITSIENFKMFEISLILIKIEALKQINETEEVPNAIKELLQFLAINKISMPDYANLNAGDFEHTFKILKSYKRHQ